MHPTPATPPEKNAATFRKKKARKLALHIDQQTNERLKAIELIPKN